MDKETIDRNHLVWCKRLRDAGRGVPLSELYDIAIGIFRDAGKADVMQRMQSCNDVVSRRAVLLDLARESGLACVGSLMVEPHHFLSPLHIAYTPGDQASTVRWASQAIGMMAAYARRYGYDLPAPKGVP